MGAWDAEARVLILDLLEPLRQRLIVARMRLVAGAGAGRFRQATGLPLCQAAPSGPDLNQAAKAGCVRAGSALTARLVTLTVFRDVRMSVPGRPWIGAPA